MKKTLCLLSFVFLTGLAGAQTVKWTVPLPGPASAPTLFPNEQAPTGVIITSGLSILRLDGNGAIKWKVDEPVSTASPASVADIDADGVNEILVELSDGTVVCLDENGQPRWTHACNGPSGGFKTIAVADVAPNPGIEVLVGCDDGWVNCLDCKGNLLWRFFGDKFRAGGGFAVADVDGDGTPEIVYSTDNGHIYCLDGAGRVKWRYNELAPYGRSGPNVADLMGNGKPEVLITRSNVGNATCLMALSAATGKYKWRTEDVMQGYCSTVTVDLDGDGTLEVVHGDKGNYLYCENCDGTRRWKTQLAGHGMFFAPCVADVDGDGQFEIIATVRGGDPKTGTNLYIVGRDGAIKSALKCGTDANVSPAVGDIDGDGTLEVIVASSGPNQVQAITWNAKGRVAWPSMRENSRMTANGNVSLGAPGVEAASLPLAGGGRDAASTSEVTVEPDDVFLGDNDLRLEWKKPAPENAFIEVSVTAPGGATETRIVDLKKGATSVTAPYRIASKDAGKLSVRLMTPGAEKPMFAAVKDVTPKPADFCYLGEVKGVCANLSSTANAASHRKDVLLKQLAQLEGEQKAIRAAAATEPEKLPDMATALRGHAEHLAELGFFLNRFWDEGGTGDFVFWRENNPWRLSVDPKSVPAQVSLAEVARTGAKDAGKIHFAAGSELVSDNMNNPINVMAYGNESEDVAITLFNTTDETIDVRCLFSEPNINGQKTPPEPELAKHVTLRRCVPVASGLTEHVYDALPELDLSRTITVPPFEGRQLWLVINTAGLKPGTHELKLYLGSLSKPPTIRMATIQIEVWPVELPTTVYRKINWSSFNKGEASDQAIKDMIDHDMSVIYGPPLPQIPVNAQGKRDGDIDWKAFDEILAKVPKHFFLLWPGPAPCKWPEGVAPSVEAASLPLGGGRDAASTSEDSAEYLAGFATGIHEMAAHLAEKGFGYDQWAFYPIDEPWNTGFTLVPALKKFCERVKKAEPKAQTYADPAGLVRPEYLDEFKDLIDVWQPEINSLKRDPKLVAWFQKNAKHFWAYEAPGCAKNLLPLGHYRANPWLAWKLGVEGTGYWVYKMEDNWFMVNDGEYSAVYPMNDDVVPSRRWEANRDGIEDYRALYVLKQEIDKARAAGRTADADHAAALINKAVDELVGWQIGTIDEITKMTRDYEIDFDLLMKYRTEIAQEIIKLRAAN